MNKIKLLPENLINQIAAGEVIERPASIVKELVENSIDAGAIKIEIEITNDCRNIRIADNGSGIPKEQVTLAFFRHATSKLSTEKDLWKISSFGFRGEALASIISVAKVTCITKTNDDQNGTKAECENSEIKLSDVACTTGTIMEVKDLFYNIPARLKFLRKNQTEFASILEIMQNIAIANTNVAFTLINKGRISLKTTGSNELAVVISEIYTKELIKELALISNEDKEFDIKISGYTSNPEFTRSSKKAIYVSVNNRFVKCPVVLKAIDNAYRDLIPNGKYPFVVVNLDIAPKQIDINVHPAKREIRYINTNQIFNFVKYSLRNALEKNNFYKPSKQLEEVQKFDEAYDFAPSSSSSNYSKIFIPKEEVQFNFDDMKAQNQASMQVYEPHEQKNLDIQLDNKYDFKILAQAFDSFIILETSEGIQFLDQHIVHERVLYEKLLKEKGKIVSQLFLTSDIINLEPSEIAFIEENKSLLQEYGYKFEIIENKGVMLKEIPQILVNSSPEKVVKDLLNITDNSIENIENNILITTSCHAAIKANQKLSIWQIEELIKDWLNTKYPQTCPHGRIISKAISKKELAGFFGRVNLN